MILTSMVYYTILNPPVSSLFLINTDGFLISQSVRLVVGVVCDSNRDFSLVEGPLAAAIGFDIDLLGAGVRRAPGKGF